MSKYTAGQVEALITAAEYIDSEDGDPYLDYAEAAEISGALRWLAATLRQQAEQDGGVVSDDRMYEALRFYAGKHHFMLSDEDAWDTVSGEPQNYWCDEAGTATVEDGSVARAAIEAVAPLLRAPAEQGGRVDEAMTIEEKCKVIQENRDYWYGVAEEYRQKLFDAEAALAQNAQGEAVGSEPCATVADAVRIADKCRSPDDEGVVWVPESCYLTMVGEIERLETLLYTDGNANIPTHPERARVPDDAWWQEFIRLVDDVTMDSPERDALIEHVACQIAAPSQPEDAA